ncbi:class I SAM-dependent methyltransferase [Fulvivirga lutimaris]|uniref:class I SAM-dependent methyltransferase n=1 Tax=Fulvivirga lutimaris TaxID=1819566 RepID=UPI0012BD033C|nr:class I SAM-dependent methyltransferase [Fulvivirga lutimaris]MTI39756.1 class I SAM-dependent methyltransferase [Fulvivirga lutimaris]
MRVNTNAWNKIRYTVFTPIYDLVGNVFNNYRRLSIEQLELKSNDNVLIVGGGTGLDLQFLPQTVNVTATDITPSMVSRMNGSIKALNLNGVARVMDGQKLEFDDAKFDCIILHLILAVIPDPVACIKEVERVLKPGGKVTVYDKFIPDESELSLGRKIGNLFTNLIATDITRKLSDILKHSNLKRVKTMNGGFKGFFKIYVLEKH